MSDPIHPSPPPPGAGPSGPEGLETVRLAEELVMQRLGLAKDAASAYLEGIAKATSTGLVVVATTLVESGRLPGPSTRHVGDTD